MVHTSNKYLTKEEMTVNARYILNKLLATGWTINAICGMLGNMETESTINSGIWQSLNEGNMSGGFGLVQWTPATNYTNWADSNGYSWSDIDGQLHRLQYEMDNGLQWIQTSDYPLSFQAFKTSTQSPEYLAQAFLRNYERPANQVQPNRSVQARYWFETLEEGGGESGDSKPFFPTTKGLPITSKYGWRIHPITEEEDFHAAIDIGGNGVNHPIYATQRGKVIYNGITDYGGWTIRIQHTGDKYYSQYQHLDVRSPLPLNASVNKGQVIGTMGTTGDSTGIHLDFAIATRLDGWFTESGTIDPEIYLEMDDGGGGGNPLPPSDTSSIKKMITLLMTDALNGWKW